MLGSNEAETLQYFSWLLATAFHQFLWNIAHDVVHHGDGREAPGWVSLGSNPNPPKRH